MKFFYVAPLLLLGFSVNAQLNRTIHSAFEVKDVKSVVIDLPGIVEVKERGGSRVLVEVNVVVNNGNPVIFDYWTKIGKYEVLADKQGESLRLYSKQTGSNDRYFHGGSDVEFVEKTDGSFNSVKKANDKIECTETITYTVYVPPSIVEVNNLSSTRPTATTGR